MSSAYGSWEQWRERVERGWGFDLAVNSHRLSEDDAWWKKEHASQAPSEYTKTIRAAGKVVQQAIADRRAG